MIYEQSQDEVLDWEWEFSGMLEDGETVASFTVTAESGLTVSSSVGGTFASTYEVTSPDTDEQGGLIAWWVAGGTNGCDYPVTIHAVTSVARQIDHVDTYRIRKNPIRA